MWIFVRVWCILARIIIAWEIHVSGDFIILLLNRDEIKAFAGINLILMMIEETIKILYIPIIFEFFKWWGIFFTQIFIITIFFQKITEKTLIIWIYLTLFFDFLNFFPVFKLKLQIIFLQIFLHWFLQIFIIMKLSYLIELL